MAATQETAIFLFFSRTDLPYRNDLSEMDGKQEHVHLLVQYPPKLPVSALVNSLKGLRCGQNVVKTKWCVSATVRPEKLSRLPIPKRPQAMLTKNDFTAEDWNTLRDTPYLVGLATLLAEPSGLGTIKESIAITMGIWENQASEIPLIRDLTSRAEMQAAQNSLKGRFTGSQAERSKNVIRDLALEHARSSIAMLSGKAVPEEIEAYRKFLYRLAEKVANASREGGVLGFGGKAVSAAEQSFLDDLQNTIQF